MRIQGITKFRPDNVCVLLVLLYVFFSQIIATFMNYTEFMIWIGASLVLVMRLINRKLVRPHISIAPFLSLLILLFIYIFHNAISLTGLSTLSIMGSFLFASSLYITLPQKQEWTRYYGKILFAFSFFHVICTLVFFVVPPVSDIMVPIWKGYLGTYAAGTENGLYNYRAGFTMHYSANGIFCTCSLICTYISYLSSTFREEKKKFLIYSILSLIALFLTAKRGPLVFGMLACCVSYIYKNRSRKLSRITKIIIIAILAFGALYFLSPMIPELQKLFSRFTDVDVSNFEEVSTGRSVYWALCFAKFLEHPFLGIGWYGFRNLYQTTIYNLSAGVQGMYLDAHNVYMQLLCETGIIGLVAYLIVVIYFLVETIRLLRQDETDAVRYRTLLFSFAFQIFYLVYSFTGNCLYDYTYYIYVLACCAMLSYKVSEIREVM